MHPMTLFSKPGCHLCAEASQLLASLGLSVLEVDISTDAALQHRYGARIPVLQAGTGEELDWPFGPADVQAFTTPA